MLCCGIGALLAGMAAFSGTRLKRTAHRHHAARAPLAIAAAAVAVGISLLTVQHFGHYADRAQANERTLLAEIMTQPR